MLTKSSRPLLAILSEDFTKFKNVIAKDELEDLMNFLIRILNIKISTDEDRENMNFQMVMIIDLIKTKFGSLTIPEIKEAFRMYVAREFSEIKVFRILDCAAVGEVLTAFTNFRTDALRTYTDKQIRERNELEQKSEDKEKIRNDFLHSVFSDIQSKQKFSSSAWLLFSDVESKLSINNATKKRLYNLQDRKYLRELEHDVISQKRRPHHVELLETAQKNSNTGKLNAIVQNRCRAIVVCNYLRQFKTFEEFRKEVEGGMD